MTEDRLPQRFGQSRTRRVATAVGAVLGLAFVLVALALPNDRADLSVEAMSAVPVEFLLLVAVLALMPRVLAPLARALAAILLTLLLTIKLADMAAYEALGRPFNPILDFHLLDAAWNLVSGAVGEFAAALAVAAIVVAIVAIALAALLSVTAIDRLVRRRRLVLGSAALALLAIGLLVPRLYPDNRSADFLTQYSYDLMRTHSTAFSASLRDLEAFEQQAEADPAAGISDEALLSQLAGKDVLFVFVESYGRTVLDNPAYSASVRPVLEEFEDVVDARGYHAASGYLTSPIRGGQSWLGHASVLSGLWVDNQRRYNSLIVSDRATLVSDFGRAGWRTVAVMPAITMAWPEGAFFGYDAIHDSDGLGYEGLPFNWVTMPDQYTLSAFDRLERSAEDRPPLFAEIALISSHAPWTPVPTVIDWDSVGDGRAFNDQARSGDTPKEVWSDHDRVRVQFRLSIEYALANLASYVEERLAGDFVMVVLGDHQPARLITGETDNRDVPYHIISSDPTVVDAMIEPFDLTRGMMPADVEAERMSVFRERLIETFSGSGSGPADGAGETGPAETVLERVGPT